MNRRNFLKAFGSAILGTAIALKIPETLIPNLPKLPTNYGHITFDMLNEAYNAGTLITKEPNFLIVNKAQYETIEEMMKPFCRYGRVAASLPSEAGIRFKGAVIIAREEKDNRSPEEISTGHYWPSMQITTSDEPILNWSNS